MRDAARDRDTLNTSTAGPTFFAVLAAGREPPSASSHPRYSPMYGRFLTFPPEVTRYAIPLVEVVAQFTKFARRGRFDPGIGSQHIESNDVASPARLLVFTDRAKSGRQSLRAVDLSGGRRIDIMHRIASPHSRMVD